MSTSFYSCFFPVEPALLHDSAVLRAEVSRQVREGLGVEIDSRSDWFLWTLGRMAADLHPSALRFLEQKSAVDFVDADDQPWKMSTLAAADVPAAGMAFAALLAQAEADPASLLDYFNDDWDLDQICEAIADPQEYDDDEGTGPDYLFLQMRGLVLELERAAAAGSAVVLLRCVT